MDGCKLAFPATLIKVLPKQKKQTIFLHIDPENAFDQKYTGTDIQFLTTKYNRNKIIKTETDKLEKNNILQNFYWCLGYNGKVLGILKNYLKPKYNYKTYFGFDPIYVSENQKKIFEKILSKEEFVNCKEKLVLNDIYENFLDELKIFCSENNKTIIIFTSPKFDDSCKNDNLEFNQILKNKGLTYYDLTDHFKDNNLNKYWKDKTHLSNIGSEILTKEVNILLNENLK
ncbi:MAG: hypothetical protein ABJL44_17345 [Algibacter sp.]